MSDTLLTYKAHSTPDPIQVSPESGDPSLASLTIIVSNSTGRAIVCKSISFSFLKGTNAKDFFADSTGISPSAPPGWSIAQDDFTATPDTPDGGKIGAGGLFFEIANIKVNQQVGATRMTITEVTSGHTGTTVIELGKFPPEFEVYDLTSDPDPPIINQGSPITLSWSGTSGAAYSLEYEGAGGEIVIIEHPQGEPNEPLPSTGSYTIEDLPGNTTIYLRVTLQVPDQDQPMIILRDLPVTVIVPVVQILSLEASPPLVYGDNNEVPVTLTWHVIAGRQFLVNGSIVEGTSTTIPVNQTETFTLEATGNQGPVYSAILVPVAAVNAQLSVIPSGINVSFNANPGSYSIECLMTSKNGNNTTSSQSSSSLDIGGHGGQIGIGFGLGIEGQIVSATITIYGFPSGVITLDYPPT